MTFKFFNQFTGQNEEFDTEAQAKSRVAQLKAEYLVRESYRFSIAYEEVNGDNVTWRSADLKNDPEDATYNVFNHYTGLHEKFVGRAAAVTRMEELKADLVSDENFGTYTDATKDTGTKSIPFTVLGE